MNDAGLESVLEELRRSRGLDLSAYRRPTLSRRLASRMAALRLTDPGEYLRRLQSDLQECVRLLEIIIIKVSSFFRDPMVFEFLAKHILPQIISQHRRRGSRQIRVWSAGCASGEEAYSAAILLVQALEAEECPLHPYICATDISDEALETAKIGEYPRERFNTTQLGILERFFRAVPAGFAISRHIQEVVHFSRDDLTSGHSRAPADSVYGSFDLVLCRNVLIYFDLELQDRVVHRLYSALNPGGYLVLGSSEALPPAMAPRFLVVDRASRIFQKPA